MLILQIETATSVCSCALSWKGETIALKELNQPNVHIEQLTLLIGEVMEVAGRSLEELEAVAVSMGPGSYTGLRIGISTAKGLCYALDIPLLAVNTLDSMAAGFVEQQPECVEYGLICPMIDARRKEVYSAIYTPHLERVAPVAARIIDERSFLEVTTSNQLVLFGDGAEKFEDTFASSEQVKVVSGFLNSARYLSGPAYQKAQRGDFEDVAYFEPFYLKDFVPTTPRSKQK